MLIPATGNVLLDTNIVIGLINREQGMKAKVLGRSIVLSTIVLGELYFGARKSGRVQDNIDRIEEFIAGYTILDCDKVTAEQYGIIKQALTIKGRPIPENDIWIAATAQQYALTLVTRDEHFRHVDGLAIEKW